MSTSLEITKENQNTLVATTIAFFLFPAAFLFYKEHYFHCACNTLSGIASILYWTHPTNPRFHTADVYISRISTTLYVLTTLSIAYQLSIEHVISTGLLTTKTVYFYMKSRNAYDLRDPNWVIYTFEHYNPHKVRIVFKGNVTDKSIKTHALRANLNVHLCIIPSFTECVVCQ